jgi:hypothetical protein
MLPIIAISLLRPDIFLFLATESANFNGLALIYLSPRAGAREGIAKIVIPAQAGIHRSASGAADKWFPAGVYPRAGRRPDPWAGMTILEAAMPL